MAWQDDLKSRAMASLSGSVESIDEGGLATDKLNREIALEHVQQRMKRRLIDLESKRVAAKECRLRAQRWELFDRAELAIRRRDLELRRFVLQLESTRTNGGIEKVCRTLQSEEEQVRFDTAPTNARFAKRLEQIELAGAGAVLESITGLPGPEANDLARRLGKKGSVISCNG